MPDFLNVDQLDHPELDDRVINCPACDTPYRFRVGEYSESLVVRCKCNDGQPRPLIGGELSAMCDAFEGGSAALFDRSAIVSTAPERLAVDVGQVRAMGAFGA